jgi:hypothetical protein
MDFAISLFVVCTTFTIVGMCVDGYVNSVSDFLMTAFVSILFWGFLTGLPILVSSNW